MTFKFSRLPLAFSLVVLCLCACTKEPKTQENVAETVKADSVSASISAHTIPIDTANKSIQTATTTNKTKVTEDVIVQNRVVNTPTSPQTSAKGGTTKTAPISKNLPQKSTAKPVSKSSTLQEKLVEMGLVDVKSVNPNIRVQLAYSGTDNFIKKDVYGDLNQAYLQQAVAEKLSKAQSELEKLHPGWALIVYDAARPFSVQQQMWNIVKGTDMAHYVAPPDAKGSIHNYGCAVDLSITNEKGIPIDMGTPFDFFGTLAHTTGEEAMVKAGKLTQKQLDNRLLLRKVMNNQGFTVLKREWWHFNAYPDAEVMRRYKRIP